MTQVLMKYMLAIKYTINTQYALNYFQQVKTEQVFINHG